LRQDYFRKIPIILVFEIGLLLSMLFTLLIPSKIVNILPWSEISLLLYIRAFIWILGLSLLPGIYFLRLTSLGKKIGLLERTVIGINLSFVFLGVLSFVLYYFNNAFSFVQWFFLGIIGFLAFFSWYRNGFPLVGKKIIFSKWTMILIAGLVVSISLALYFQVGLRYLLPGDIWVSLKPSVQIFSQTNVYEAFSIHHYPLMFGFILAAFSSCSGLPIVNVYALLFPLAGLNLLSYYIFIKKIFNLDEKTAILAYIIYGFGSGLGLLIQILGYNGELYFMNLASLTRDFSLPNIFVMTFFHKSIALTQAFASIASLIYAIKLKKNSSKIVGLLISILLILFAFYIHMIEGLIFMPLIPLILYKYEKKWFRYFILYVFLLAGVMIIFDFFMEGYYFWLSLYKIVAVANIIGYNKILTYSSIFLVVLLTILLGYFFTKKRESKLGFFYNRSRLIKIFLIIIISVIYIGGLWYWNTFAQPDSFPWYRYVTRYGFIGLLALIGIFYSRWRGNNFFISSLWGIYIIIVGFLWWESRISGYLISIVCFFAAIGIIELLKKSMKIKTSIMFKLGSNSGSNRNLNLNFKLVTSGLIGCVFLLSFISTLYGSVYYFSWDRPCISDNTAEAFLWINTNISKDYTLLVPNIYNIHKGVYTICDRDIFIDRNLPGNFTSFIELLIDRNVKYAFTFEDEKNNFLVETLLSQSNIIFQSGNVLIYELPDLENMIREGLVIENENELILFNTTYTFGWKEDEFLDDWNYQNTNPSNQEDILIIEWELQELYSLEPQVRRKTPLIDTNTYPYLIIKYNNEPDSPNVSQIISLINQTGYPDGFIENYYIPITNLEDNSFELFIVELPSNQEVADIWIWMRNWQSYNGTITLKIDYLGFANQNK
jgi:hypothetical protein